MNKPDATQPNKYLILRVCLGEGYSCSVHADHAKFMQSMLRGFREYSSKSQISFHVYLPPTYLNTKFMLC